MRRRKVIRLLSGSAVAALAQPHSAHAQRGPRLPTIGWTVGDLPLTEISGPDPSNKPARAFVHRLRDLGWIEGRTVRIERRAAGGRRDQAPALLAEVVALGADVIFTGSTDWLIDIAHKATSAIPIVAVFNRDPVAAGLVASFGRPGGNMTGIATTTGRESYDKRLQIFRELVPQVRRIAFLGTRLAWESYLAGADAGAVPPIFAPVDLPQDYESAFALVLRERADSLIVSHGPMNFINAGRIAAFAADNRLPAAYPWREASEAGGLMSYGSSAQVLFRQAAGYVDRVLKGANPAELPIERPSTFELVINLRTARALGLDVPASMLALADDVIE